MRRSKKELEDLGLSWAFVRTKVQDQRCWRTVAEALCAPWHDKDR